MTIELNHTIVPARDKVLSAKFFPEFSDFRSMGARLTISRPCGSMRHSP